jgi:hypothetical protein
MIESDPVITVETSCGETIKHRPSEMTDWQLTGLLKQNSPRTDVDQTLISAMRDELFRRVFQPMDETWINHEPLEGQLKELLHVDPACLLWRLVIETVTWAAEEQKRKCSPLDSTSDAQRLEAYAAVIVDAREEMRGTCEGASKAASLVQALAKAAISKAAIAETEEIEF